MFTNTKTRNLSLWAVFVFLSGISACLYLSNRFSHVLFEDSVVNRIVLIRQALRPLDLLIVVILLVCVGIEILIVALLSKKLVARNTSEGHASGRDRR